MAKRLLRIFAEIDFPETMVDPEEGNPYKASMILRQIVNSGSATNGYTVEEFQQDLEIGFKLVKT
ncbi:MAG: hypothetical protein V3V81_08160 [Candidatus Bathyarchaeia archaeon]